MLGGGIVCVYSPWRSLSHHAPPALCRVVACIIPPPLHQHAETEEINGQTGSPCLDKAVLARHTQYQKNACRETCPYLTLTTTGLDWEEDTVQRSMMLNLMPIPRVLHMNEINSTCRTDNCGGHMCTGGPDVRNRHASDSNISHG